MKSWRLPIFVWASLIVFLVLLAGGVALFPQFILDSMLPDQTIYARGFSDEKWANVRLGDTGGHVQEMLGMPLQISEYGKEGLYRTRLFEGDFQYQECYSNVRPPSSYDPGAISYRVLSYSQPGRWSDSYQVRAVRVDRADRVVRIETMRHED